MINDGDGMAMGKRERWEAWQFWDGVGRVVWYDINQALLSLLRIRNPSWS